MINSLSLYGIEESIGIHVILSNLFWWTSLILVITAYKNRRIWNVGEMPWTYLFLTFLFFGIRELGHLTKSSLLDSIRYIFGICSAIFMTSALILIYMKIYKRKTTSKSMSFIPLMFALIFPAYGAASFKRAGETMEELTVENIDVLIYESKNYMVVTVRAGMHALLIVLAGKNVQMGLVLMNTQKTAIKIKEI